MPVKILSIILLFLGEALSIYAELYFAEILLHPGITPRETILTFIKMILVITLGGIFLLGGYYLGYFSFKNIWIITVVSITAILIADPFLAYTFFKQIPGKGAIIGLTLGVLGMISTLVF